MTLGSDVGPVRAPGGALHAIIATTSTGTGAEHALGGAFGIFAVQIVGTTGATGSPVEAHLQGSLDGANWVNIGATNAWSTTQNLGTLVQVQSSAPVTYARLDLSKHATTENVDGFFCCLPSVST